MGVSTFALIACLCLTSFILGMIVMSILLHPHRQEAKRLRKMQEEHQRYQQRIRKVNQ